MCVPSTPSSTQMTQLFRVCSVFTGTILPQDGNGFPADEIDFYLQEVAAVLVFTVSSSVFFPEFPRFFTVLIVIAPFLRSFFILQCFFFLLLYFFLVPIE